MKINMKMSLLSDAIPGSGNSLAGMIDREISYDKYGFPYIPAKRIKGILRESAEDVRLSQTTINELFGMSGSTTGCSLIIDNGQLPKLDELRIALQGYNDKHKKKPIGKEDVLGFYTYTRAQTTIDERGIAKDKSLRISRVVKKKLVFIFNVELPKKFFEDFQRICKVTRSFGSSRNRGFGEIKLELYEYDNAILKPSHALSNDLERKSLARIVLKLENKSQLVVSNKVGMNQVSDDYIAGNFILGALAYKYLKLNGVDPIFKKLFLTGEISFGNLYPNSKDGTKNSIYYPTTYSIKKIKSSNTSHYPINYYLDLSNCDLDSSEFKNVKLKGGFSGFVNSTGNKITVNKEVESHHSRPKNRAIAKAGKSEGEFYQFETIGANHYFTGEIRGHVASLIEVKKLLDNDNVLRLGKSKTGQYAKCAYQPVKIEPVSDKPFTWKHRDEVKLIAQSDILLYNKDGFAEPTISNLINTLSILLKLDKEKLKLTKGFIKKSNKGGFVGVWGLPKIQVPVISAGSVIILENCGETLELPRETIFIGDRVEEGYGRLIISDQFSDQDVIQFRIEERRSQCIPQSTEFDEIVNYYIKAEMERYLTSQAIIKSKNLSNSSTLARLKRFIVASNSFEEFSTKLTSLKSNSQKDNLHNLFKDLYLINSDCRIEIDIKGFKKEILNLKDYPQDFIDQRHSEEPFSYYKIYVKSLLDQIKLSNRRKQ